eukprot:TRINITY_DN3858_c0_g1_i4.p1 TRINITY_DN3858_c0_g1~~TRINITY_DN3858_c0_g1_i4.p1  ORF type:complete len:402 (+),score=57.29 TRINITY_DN3858_c0_g1_i4:62-1207(+)
MSNPLFKLHIRLAEFKSRTNSRTVDTEVLYANSTTWNSNSTFLIPSDVVVPAVVLKFFGKKGHSLKSKFLGEVCIDLYEKKAVDNWFTFSVEHESTIRILITWEQLGALEPLENRHLVVKYEEIKEKLGTGDIVLCHGVERISRGIEVATGSFWSHVAMIIRDPPENIKKIYKVEECLQKWRNDQQVVKDLVQQIDSLYSKSHLENLKEKKKFQIWKRKGTVSNLTGIKWPDLMSPLLDIDHLRQMASLKIEDDNIYLFESDMSTFDKREGGGVQMVPLGWWLFDNEKYYGKAMYIVIRRLCIPSNPERKFPNFWEWMEKIAGTLYEVSKSELVRSVTKSNKIDNLATVFCSELITASYKVMGLLPEQLVSSNMLPKDYAR